MNFKNLCRFSVDLRFFDNLKPGEGVNIFTNMVVWEAKPDFTSRQTHYIATHPDFRSHSGGEIIPEYRPVFTKESAIPRWEEVMSK